MTNAIPQRRSLMDAMFADGPCSVFEAEIRPRFHDHVHLGDAIHVPALRQGYRICGALANT